MISDVRCMIRLLTNRANKVNRVRWLPDLCARMKTIASLPGLRYDLIMRFAVLAFGLVIGFAGADLRAQGEPMLVPDVVDYNKLLPLMPEPPAGWKADKPEGSTMDVGGFKLTNVHRDYQKGEGDKVPSAAISILDSAANPDYVAATTAAWALKSETPEGYSKPVTIDGNPGFEAYESNLQSPDELKKLRAEQEKLLAAASKDKAALTEVNRKINESTLKMHSTLWVMVAKRYFVQIELMGEDPKELQEWIKRVDLKKLAEIKS